MVEEDISEEISSLIEGEKIMSIYGTLGERECAMPIEYEEVVIKADGNETSFEVYNKGMSMVTNETPELKRAFKLCVKLQRAFRL